MNINDLKHPAARQVDEMILAGAPAKEIMAVIAKLPLIDMVPFVRDCIFVGRLFLYETVMACFNSDCLGVLTALSYHMDCEAMGDLLGWETLLSNRGGVGGYSFWNAVRSCGERASEQRERQSYPRCAQQFDFAFEHSIFLDRPFLEQPNGVNWMLNRITNRAKDGTAVLSASRWSNRIFQPDVFRAVSEENAWLMCQTLPLLRINVKRQLARQVFLGLSDESDERMDVLRKKMWNDNFLRSPGNGWGFISCESYLMSCIGVEWGGEREQSPYLIRDGFRFKNDNRPNSQALKRFSDNDSIASMMMGETITGCRTQVGDLLRWVGCAKHKLFCEFLPRLASELTPELVTNIVVDIVYNWPCAAAQQSLSLIENQFPKHIRSMHDCWGYNLLLDYRRFFRPDNDKCSLLISLGCDPDEKCLMGYSWNDVQRWEGKKCASR